MNWTNKKKYSRCLDDANIPASQANDSSIEILKEIEYDCVKKDTVTQHSSVTLTKGFFMVPRSRTEMTMCRV